MVLTFSVGRIGGSLSSMSFSVIGVYRPYRLWSYANSDGGIRAAVTLGLPDVDRKECLADVCMGELGARGAS